MRLKNTLTSGALAARVVSAAAGVGALVLTMGAVALAGQPTDPLTPPANSPRRAEPGYHAIVGATVHVSAAETLKNATVVVRNGRIDSVAEGGEGPAGATVWPGAGLHVYAGFIEPYLEVEAPKPDADEKGAHWNLRVTPQRDVLSGKGVSDDVAKSLRGLGFTAAMIVPQGGVFRGQGAVVSLAKVDADLSQPRPPVYRAGVAQVVAFETGRGESPGAGRWEGYPDSQMGAIALIRQTLSDAAYRAGERERLGAAAGASCLDALEPKGAAPLLFVATDALEVLRARAVAAEFGRAALVLGSGVEYQRLDAVVAEKEGGLIVPVNYPKKPKAESIGEAETLSLRELLAWEQAPSNLRRLDAAGARVAVTTARLRERGQFRENMRLAVRAGLPEGRALAMMTEVPAAMLGVGDQVGRVARGMRANLVVMDGPVFGKKTKVRDVWVDGQRHEVNAAPSSLEGTWDVVLSPGPLKPGALTLVIDKDNAVVVKKQAAEEPTPAEAAPKPEAKPPEGAVGGAGAAAEKAEPEKTAEKPKKAAESKARGVVFANGRLSFVFEHAPFGEAGVFTMSGVVSPDKVGMLGDGVRADGARFAWTATRRPEPPKAEPAKEEPAKEGAAKPDGEAKEPAQQEAAKPDAAKKDGKGEEEEEPLDIPEALPGYPFGPYALAKPPQLDRVAIVNATVWTSAAAGIIRDGAVVISEGKIVYVGAAAAMPRLGEGFVTFDAQGKHVTPGIVDCHSHTGISKGVNEAGQAVTAEVRIGDVTDPDSISWYRQLAGGVTAVNNLHGSANPIGGQNQVNKNRWGVARPDGLHLEGAIPGIKFALGENVKQSNWGDRFTGRYPQTRMGVEALIRDRFLAAQAYTRAWAAHAAANGEGVLKGMPASFVNSVKKNAGTAAVAVSPSAAGGKDAPPRRDLELEALAEILAGERLVHCHSYRQDEILMLARVAQEFGFKIGTYQHILEGYKVAEAVRDFSGGGSAFSDWWGFKVEVQDAIPQAGPIMHEQGAVVSYNSDSDELARRMNVEAAKAVKYSLVAGVASVSPEEALKFVTINPAKQLRIDGRVGSLEAGKDADVVVWTADPLSVYARAERTWVDGRLYFSLERDAELRARDAKERQRLLQKLLAEGKKPKGEEKAAEGEGGGAAGGGGGAPGRRRPRPPQGGDEAGVLAGDAGDGSSAARASDEPRTLLSRMHRDAVVYRRELYLDLLRRGLDPAWARSGDCGCDATGAVQ